MHLAQLSFIATLNDTPSVSVAAHPRPRPVWRLKRLPSNDHGQPKHIDPAEQARPSPSLSLSLPALDKPTDRLAVASLSVWSFNVHVNVSTLPNNETVSHASFPRPASPAH